MTVAAGTLDEAGLRSVAESLLDRLDPTDVDDLAGRRTSRSDLVGALAHRAALAGAALAREGEPVPAARRDLLVLACLTLNRKSGGVHERTDRAVLAYRRYRGYPNASPEDLALVLARYPDDLDELVPLLERVNRLRAGLEAAGAADPPFVLDLLIPAVAVLLERSGALADDEPRVARRVLDRGAELARLLTASRSSTADRYRGLPVLGNADFVARLAAYRVALHEETGATDNPGLPDLDAATLALTESMYRAMTTVVGRLGLRGGPGDCDVLAAFDQYTHDLGVAVGGRDREGRLVRLLYVLRTRHLRPARPASAGSRSGLPSRPDPTTEVDELDLLVRALVAGLFERSGPALRPTLLEWLGGRRPPDRAHQMDDLVTSLRVATARLVELARQPGDVPAGVIGLSEQELTGLVKRLSAKVRPSGLSGSRQADTLRVADLALPPLWTRRGTVVRLIAAHRRAKCLRGDDPDKVLVLARAGVRAPVQFFQPGSTEGTCCPEGDRAALDGPAPPEALACPHRPWGERGLLDNYSTIRNGTGYSPEAVRKMLSRYRGPDRAWLLGIQPALRPDDC